MELLEIARHIALYLALAAFLTVAVRSYQGGVDLLLVVLRGIGAFFAVFIFYRLTAGILETFGKLPEIEAEAEAESAEAELEETADLNTIGVA